MAKSIARPRAPRTGQMSGGILQTRIGASHTTGTTAVTVGDVEVVAVAVVVVAMVTPLSLDLVQKHFLIKIIVHTLELKNNVNLSIIYDLST